MFFFYDLHASHQTSQDSTYLPGDKSLKIRSIGENVIEVRSESQVILISLPLPFSKESSIKVENSMNQNSSTSSQEDNATLVNKEETNAAPLTTQSSYTPVFSHPVVSPLPSPLNSGANPQASVSSDTSRGCSII